MRRKRLRRVVLALILISLSGVFYQLYSSLRTQRERRVDRSPLEGMLPQAVQWIQKFHRIEIKDGRKAWEVQADEAQYLEETGQVLVRHPQASFFLRDGEEVSVQGGQGKLEFEGKDLQKVTLHDNVEIRVRGFLIRAGQAVYDRDEDRVLAEGPVSVVGPDLELNGNDMVVFMKDSRFELQKNVRVTILPRAERSKQAS